MCLFFSTIIRHSTDESSIHIGSKKWGYIERQLCLFTLHWWAMIQKPCSINYADLHNQRISFHNFDAMNLK